MQETSGNQTANSVETLAASPRPLLVYDGDCAFCGYWARYWKKLTGDSVDYRLYQEVAAQYPAIPLADFQRAVQYIDLDGHYASAAEASFLTLSHARGKGFWLALYRKLPGFAAISELVYAFIAAHRSAFYRISLFRWGKDYGPPRHDLVSFLFLRLFGLIRSMLPVGPMQRQMSAFPFGRKAYAGTPRRQRAGGASQVVHARNAL